MPDQWWKDAIIYAVEVERFCDSDGDGFGDFKGLASKLPYLADLGVTCLWILPFYPSSNRDIGYDVTDYLRVDSRHGLFEDFLECLHKAGEQGILVVVDLVAQHTSDHHPCSTSTRRRTWSITRWRRSARRRSRPTCCASSTNARPPSTPTSCCSAKSTRTRSG